MPLDSRVLAAWKRTGGRLRGTPDLQQSLLIPCLCPEAFSKPQRGMQCGDLPPESLPRVWLPESHLGSLSSLLPTGKKMCPCHVSLVTSSHCPSPHDPPPLKSLQPMLFFHPHGLGHLRQPLHNPRSSPVWKDSSSFTFPKPLGE